jgi:O-antigen ligase
MRAREWLTAGAALAAVLVSVFVVGGVLRWTQAVVAALVALSLCGVLISRRAPSRLSPLTVLIAVALGLTVLQLIPLPEAVLSSLTPMASALRQDGADLLDISPWSGLSSDSAGTLRAVTFLLTLLGLAVVALRSAASERGRFRILAVITATCGAVALTVAIHKLFDAKALFGLYEPEYAQPRMLGPLLNMNSLGCLMAVGAVCGIGLAAYPRQSVMLRVLWVIVVAGCGTLTAAVISRGATLALAAGAIITIGILVAQRLSGPEQGRKRRIDFVSSALPIGVVVACLIVLVIYANASSVEAQLEQMSLNEISQKTSKFAAWKSSLTLVTDAPWIGIGRGAFESSFTRVHPASGAQTYSHVENEYLQAAVDWGLPGTVLLGIAGLWLAYTALRRWRDGPLAAAGIGALTVIATQSTVDFGIELLGIAVPATAIAATLAYVPIRETSRYRVAVTQRVVHVCALLLGSCLLLTSATRSLEEDHLELANRPLKLSTVIDSLDRHPLDYYGYATAAEILDNYRDPRAIRLLNHAMTLHPTHPGLHRMAGRMLFRDGFVEQAAVEYAAALEAMDPRKLMDEILTKFTKKEQAALALPVDFRRPDQMVAVLAEHGRSDVARRWLTRVLERHPKDRKACELLYGLAIRDEHVDTAVFVSHRCAATMPDYQMKLSLARLLARKGNHPEVLTLLADVDSWQSRVEDKIAGWLALCDSEIALGALDDAKRCLRRLDSDSAMRSDRRVEIIRRLESIEEARRKQGSSVQPLAGSAAAP